MTNKEWFECHGREAFDRAVRAKANKDPDWYRRILLGGPAESLRCFDAWLNEEHKDDK